MTKKDFKEKIKELGKEVERNRYTIKYMTYSGQIEINGIKLCDVSRIIYYYDYEYIVVTYQGLLGHEVDESIDLDDINELEEWCY